MLRLCDKANFAFLLFYTVECLVRVYALRRAFFHSKWNVFDVVIVFLGAVGEIFESMCGDHCENNMEHFQVLRCLRMLRLLRAARVIISFKELYSLICGMSSCLKTLLWAAALVFLMLTMWSIIGVEYLHTIVSELARNGHYDDCAHCGQSFQNIMFANLTFFQIVSGDGWSDLARPLIVHHPWTAALFVGVIFTMVFGMLNLITAVIVDTAAQARESDVVHMAAQKAYERKYAWSNVAKICNEMDTDKDGNISFPELEKGTKDIPELNAYLSVLGVENHELHMIFDMLDDDQHGKIPINDLCEALYKMQIHEHKTTHVFVKHYVEDIRKHVREMVKISQEWSRQNSEEMLPPAREPETEPKHNESPPWMPMFPIWTPKPAAPDCTSDTQGKGVLEFLDHVRALPSSPEREHATMKLEVEEDKGNDGPADDPCVMTSPSATALADDVELGIYDAVAQYQSSAFPSFLAKPSTVKPTFAEARKAEKALFAQQVNIIATGTQSPAQMALPILLGQHQQGNQRQN